MCRSVVYWYLVVGVLVVGSVKYGKFIGMVELCCQPCSPRGLTQTHAYMPG